LKYGCSIKLSIRLKKNAKTRNKVVCYIPTVITKINKMYGIFYIRAMYNIEAYFTEFLGTGYLKTKSGSIFTNRNLHYIHILIVKINGIYKIHLAFYLIMLCPLQWLYSLWLQIRKGARGRVVTT
jgi:hypothetical protein